MQQSHLIPLSQKLSLPTHSQHIMKQCEETCVNITQRGAVGSRERPEWYKRNDALWIQLESVTFWHLAYHACVGGSSHK